MFDLIIIKSIYIEINQFKIFDLKYINIISYVQVIQLIP